MVEKGQVTLDTIENVQKIRGLTPNERRVVNLIGLGFFPADVARKMKVSPPYINTLLKKLLSKGLIQRTAPTPRADGRREYHHHYQISPQVKEMVKGESALTACRVHNIRKKFTIISQSGTPSVDKRASFTKSWKMRGWTGYKYWFPGKAGQPSCTIDVNPKTLVIYIDKGQEIPARSPEEAKEIAWTAIYRARDMFVGIQERFGIRFEISHAGEDIAKPHGGFAIGEKTAEEGVSTPGWWIDRSDTKEMSYAEAETDIPEGMSRLDRTIKLSEKIETLEALPEAMREINLKLDPMNDRMAQLVSQLQGGRPIEAMFQNALDMMLRMMEKMDKMDAELKALKEGK